MSSITALQGAEALLPPSHSTAAPEDKTVAKAQSVFVRMELENSPKPAEKCDERCGIRITAVAALLFYGLFMGGVYYFLWRGEPGTALQCRPTIPSGPLQDFRPIGIDPGLLPKYLEITPAAVVHNATVTLQEAFTEFEVKLRLNWKNVPKQDELKAVGLINRKGQEIAESRVTCLTGQIFGSNPAHAAMAALLHLPFSTETDVESPLYQLRALNENFPPSVDNPTFVTVCQEFITMAQMRNAEQVLNSDGEWIVADYSPWIKEAERVLKPYTKNSEYSWLNYLDKVTAEHYGPTGLAQLVNAPPMYQIAAVQTIRDEMTARLVRGDFTPETRQGAERVISELRKYQAALTYTARTGEPRSDWDTELLFSWVYYADSSDQSQRMFSSSLDELQNLIDQGDRRYPVTRVKDIFCSLHSIAKSFNGTYQYVVGDPSLVDMSFFIARLEKGIRFGNEIWKPA